MQSSFTIPIVMRGILLVFAFLTICSKNYASETFAEFRVAYFIPESSSIREIYGAGVSYQFEVSTSLREHLDLWANASYFRKTGHSIPLEDYTRIWMLPLALGIKLKYEFRPNLNGYAGVGGSFSWVDIKNQCAFVYSPVKETPFGAVFKLGVMQSFHHLFIDVFLDYQIQHISFEKDIGPVQRCSINLNGCLMGIGIGGRF